MNQKLTNGTFRISAASFLVLGTSLIASGAHAQEAPEGEAENEAQPAPDEGLPANEPDAGEANADADEGGEAGSDFAPEVDDQRNDRPNPPGDATMDELDSDDVEPPTVVRGAGMGSEIAYAEQGVVELGGLVNLDIRGELYSMQIAPTFGYFVADRLELTLIPIVQIAKTVDGETGFSETFVRVAGVLEPSYHLPLTDDLFAFAGLGLGLTYEEGNDFEFLIRPVVGMDIMVGRSGILKPAGFLDVGFGDGAIGGGFQAGYTVMF